MFYSTTTQSYISENTPFEINGTQYPANWLNLSTPAEKIEIGLEEVIATNSPANDKFYWVNQTLDGASLTYVNIPKELTTCKTNLIEQIKTTAYSLLFPSDWMVVKAFETSTTLPTEWNTWRQTIRTQAQTGITAINACTTIKELESIQPIIWANDPNYVPLDNGNQ